MHLCHKKINTTNLLAYPPITALERNLRCGLYVKFNPAHDSQNGLNKRNQLTSYETILTEDPRRVNLMTIQRRPFRLLKFP